MDIALIVGFVLFMAVMFVGLFIFSIYASRRVEEEAAKHNAEVANDPTKPRMMTFEVIGMLGSMSRLETIAEVAARLRDLETIESFRRKGN